jgi:hypothetical protein
LEIEEIVVAIYMSVLSSWSNPPRFLLLSGFEAVISSGLIADSTLPSGPNVLQQIYPDFLQVDGRG